MYIFIIVSCLDREVPILPFLPGLAGRVAIETLIFAEFLCVIVRGANL